ncbi:MAG TPA: hypothetical protein VJS13_04295 [Pyrinomonadaceae bacterium]|nr:hypothetical protein [Pyrinomonadaceae bacterium]
MTDNIHNRVRQMFLYGFPIGTFVATWIYWLLIERVGFALPIFILIIPVIFAFAAIRIIVGPLGLWTWRMSMLHLSFLWSTYSALGILIVSDSIAAPFTLTSVIKTAIFCGILGGLIGTLIDIVGIDQGLLELHYCTMERGNVNTVLSYSFKFFGAFSAIYGILAKVGHYVLVERSLPQWLPVLILGASALLIGPYLIHFLLTGRDAEPAVATPPTSEPPVAEPPL